MLTTMLLVANTAPLNKMSLDHGSVSCCTVTICICGALYAPDIPSFHDSIGVKSRVQSYRHAKTNAVAGQETAPVASVSPNFPSLRYLGRLCEDCRSATRLMVDEELDENGQRRLCGGLPAGRRVVVVAADSGK